MLQQIDKLNDIPEIVGFFQKLYDESGYTMLSESDLEREGYVRVRKVSGILRSINYLLLLRFL